MRDVTRAPAAAAAVVLVVVRDRSGHELLMPTDWFVASDQQQVEDTCTWKV